MRGKSSSRISGGGCVAGGGSCTEKSEKVMNTRRQQMKIEVEDRRGGRDLKIWGGRRTEKIGEKAWTLIQQ